MISAVQRQYASAKYCLHPDAGKTCKGAIIQAHTIQRKGSLNKIAEGGKVMNFNAPGAHVLKTRTTEASLIGLKDASVFTGFCGQHDETTFKPIEAQAIQFSEQHYFLLAYRAICKELYEREIGVRIIPFLRTLDSGVPVANQVRLQDGVQRYDAWTTYRRDCTLHHKQQYDTMLQSNAFSSLQYYALRLGACPDIVCSCAFCPRFDFAGKPLQEADMRRRLDIITCSLVAAEGGGMAVFSWVGQSTACERFIQSLDWYNGRDLPQAVVRLAFYSFQNMYARPAWWNALDKATQDNLLRRRSCGMGVEHSIHPDCYMDDGITAVTWDIGERMANFASHGTSD